jgi:hypothetical protein
MKNKNKYIVSGIATIMMVVFALIYEARIPMWWVVSMVVILGGYGYLYHRIR